MIPRAGKFFKRVTGSLVIQSIVLLFELVQENLIPIFTIGGKQATGKLLRLW